jgi:hypothetical protein
MSTAIRLSRRAAYWLALGLTATVAFAQNSSFGQAAQGINGGAIIDHEAPRERRFAAVEK